MFVKRTFENSFDFFLEKKYKEIYYSMLLVS